MISLVLYVDKDLAFQLESDVVESYRQLIAAWNSSYFETKIKGLEIDNTVSIYGDLDFPINETVVGLGMVSAVDETLLNDIENFYRINNSSSFVIRACSLSDPSLIELTQKRGYVLDRFSYRWFLDLEKWHSPFFELDKKVEIVDDTGENDWARTVASGFENVDDVSEEYNLDFQKACFCMKSSIPVCAYDKNIISAGGMLVLHNRIVSLFSTSTKPSFRKKGYQTALIDWILRYAQQNGATIATIETEPGSASQRNVERLGFRLAYVVADLIKVF